MKFLQKTTLFLWILAAVLAVVLVIVLIIPSSALINDRDQVEVTAAVPSQSGQGGKKASFQEYEKVFSQRDVFQSGLSLARDAEQELRAEKPAAEMQGMFNGRYRISGIMIDRDPKVVFEDTRTHETFFLSSGEKLGQAVVQEILPGEVILSVGGKTVTVKP